MLVQGLLLWRYAGGSPSSGHLPRSDTTPFQMKPPVVGLGSWFTVVSATRDRIAFNPQGHLAGVAVGLESAYLAVSFRPAPRNVFVVRPGFISKKKEREKIKLNLGLYFLKFCG